MQISDENNYNPSYLIDHKIKKDLKYGLNTILLTDICGLNDPLLYSIPFVIITYKGKRHILIKTFKQYPLTIVKKENCSSDYYINDSLVSIEDMCSILIYPKLKNNHDLKTISFECSKIKPKKSSIKMEINEENKEYKSFFDELIEHFIIEKKTMKNNTIIAEYLNSLCRNKRDKLIIEQNTLDEEKQKRSESIKKCVICLERKIENGLLNNCKHEFCIECLNQWVKVSSQCPICKKDFTEIAIKHSENEIKPFITKIKQQTFTFDESPVESWFENCDEHCFICKQGDNTPLLLVCDKCDIHIAHTYCVGLDSIPDGEWFCPTCNKLQKQTQKKEINILKNSQINNNYQ